MLTSIRSLVVDHVNINVTVSPRRPIKSGKSSNTFGLLYAVDQFHGFRVVSQLRIVVEKFH